MSETDPAAALELSGQRADAAFTTAPPSQTRGKCQKPTWFQFKLVDYTGKPVPNRRYILTLPDGSTSEGTLDKEGVAGVEGIDPGQCTVIFPGFAADEVHKVSGAMSIS